MKTIKAIFDTATLKKRIVDKYGSMNAFALHIKMDPKTLKAKLDRKEEFYEDEIIPIKRALHLNMEETREMFSKVIENEEDVYPSKETQILNRKRELNHIASHEESIENERQRLIGYVSLLSDSDLHLMNRIARKFVLGDS